MSHHGPMDAYSEDLRDKIVEAVQQRRMSKSEAARAFGVSRSSVKRYVKAVCEGRSLRPGKAPGKKPKLDEKAKRLLEADIEERPFAKLKSYLRGACARSQDTLMEVIGKALSTITVSDACGYFEHCGYRAVVQSL